VADIRRQRPGWGVTQAHFLLCPRPVRGHIYLAVLLPSAKTGDIQTIFT